MFKTVQMYIHAALIAVFLGAIGFGLYQWGKSRGQLTEKVELEHFLKAQIYKEGPPARHHESVDTTDCFGSDC